MKKGSRYLLVLLIIFLIVVSIIIFRKDKLNLSPSLKLCECRTTDITLDPPVEITYVNIPSTKRCEELNILASIPTIPTTICRQV